MANAVQKPRIIFDPDDPLTVRHTKEGPISFYDDISAARLRGRGAFSKLISATKVLGLGRTKELVEVYHRWPYVRRMLKDIASIEGNLPYLVLPLFLQLVKSFIPPLSLWYTTQLIKLTEVAIEQRVLDKHALLWNAAGQAVTSIALQILNDAEGHFTRKLNDNVRRFFDIKYYDLSTRFDLATFNNPNAQPYVRGMSILMRDSLWSSPRDVIGLISSVVTLIGSVFVLLEVLREHSGIKLLLLFGALRMVLDGASDIATRKDHGLRVVKFTSDAYIKLGGLRKIAWTRHYRREILAGGLGGLLAQQYRQCIKALGSHSHNTPQTDSKIVTGWPWFISKLNTYARGPLNALSQLYTCIVVVNAPLKAPLSLATVRLVEDTVSALLRSMRQLLSDFNSFVDNVTELSEFYKAFETEDDAMKDGTLPFPENTMDVKQGVSVEFRNVSFRYSPDSKTVLRNLSFKIEQGQLCVIVGENGSGKSTILSLINRIYDVTEGEILINGTDLRKLKLDDLRKTMAVLFQEYVILPLTVKDNIGFGDPENPEDMDRIRQAATLCGANDFIDALPDRYNSHFARPLDVVSPLTEGSQSIFAGKDIDFSKLWLYQRNIDMSGGQKQRIALARTFMRSIVSQTSSVGLLLFDEPSANLDPKAEHDLFTQLREIRGSKTMIFSSHRFGKLTRHADLILCVHDGQIVEAGNHATLMKAEGQYAKYWNLQAQDFF